MKQTKYIDIITPDEIANQEFSIYQNIMEFQTTSMTNLQKLIEQVRGNEWESKVMKLVNLAECGNREDPDSVNLPIFTISKSGGRSKHKVLSQGEHTGLLGIQIQSDPINWDDDLGLSFQADPYIVAGFKTYDWEGLFLVVAIERSFETHGASFHAVKSYFQKNYDLKIEGTRGDAKDCFLVSHDPDAWIKSEPVTVFPI